MRIILVGLCLLFPILAVAQTRTETVEAPVIRVAGTGSAIGTPDLLQLYVTVLTNDSAAQSGAARNAVTAANVQSALRGQLGPGSLLTTVSYTLDPVYVYPRQGGEPVLSGYAVRNLMRVETTELAKVGTLIDVAIRAGANSVSGISYILRDQSQLRADALTAAARQARTKGESLAEAMGVRLGALRSIVENVGTNQGPVDARQQVRDDARATQIESGPVEASTDVILTFDIIR